jgi:hypothetical protein
MKRINIANLYFRFNSCKCDRANNMPIATITDIQHGGWPICLECGEDLEVCHLAEDENEN